MGEAPSVADFFARVVPWPSQDTSGVNNLHWTLVKYVHGMGGRPFSTLVDFMTYIDRAKNRPASIKDIYFCLSMQKKTGPVKNGYVTAYRNKDNVAGLKAIWLDLDVKASAYQTTEEALIALHEFCQTTGYPKPTAIVFSGSGGAHVYWISDRMLTFEEWFSYANGLKQLGIERGLKADYTCTIDSGRVLRVPDTFNHKTTPPNPVSLKMLAPKDINFEAELGKFRSTATLPPVRAARDDWQYFDPAVFPKRAFPAEIDEAEYRLEIGTPRESLPVMPEGLIEKCPMFLHANATGGKDADQGLWMMQVLATTFCHNGREFAHRISKGHKGYSPAETDEMFDRKEEEQHTKDLGWPTCQSFENFCSGQCALCPRKGKIRSPLNLGTPVKNEGEAPPFSLALPVANEAALSMRLPGGYFVHGETGYIGTMVSKPSGGGGYIDEWALLFRTKIKDPWRERDHGLHFKAEVERGEWQDCFISREDLQTEVALTKSLNKQGIILDPDYRPLAVRFMSYWMEKLRMEQDALTAVAFGWADSEKEGLGWAYNGKIVRENGKEAPAGALDLEVKHVYTPTGDLQKWFEVLKLVTDQKRPALEAIVATAFAAPLMRFTGQDGGTICAYGKTGANKSTAAQLGLAVWGHPVNTKEVATTSMKSLLKKMGDVRNLPLYWDDVTEPDQLKRATEIASAGTEGIEGGKLTTGRQQMGRGTWQTLVQINSNNSLIDRIKLQSNNNLAQSSRVFEYYVPLDETHGQRTVTEAPVMMAALRQNFGRVGEIYSTILGQSSTDLAKMVSEYSDKFSTLVEAKKAERFWVAICAVLITGSVLANKMGASFDLDAMQKFLYDAFLELRGRVYQGASADSVDIEQADQVITEFLKANSENTLRTKNVAGRGRVDGEKVGYVKGPMRDVKINVSWVLTPRLLRFARGPFETYLQENNYSPAMIFRQLKKQYGMRTARLNLCAGVPHNGGQETVLILQVPQGHWLEEAMYAYTSASDLTHSGQPA